MNIVTKIKFTPLLGVWWGLEQEAWKKINDWNAKKIEVLEEKIKEFEALEEMEK